MMDYDLIFVVVVYRNVKDLRAFLDSLRGLSLRYRVVVVDSIYDSETTAALEALCRERDCDLLSLPNRGYGSGNNSGIAFARSRYRFGHLIVCNPDTVLQSMPGSLPRYEGAILGPQIKTRTGKRQNPCMVVYSPLREFLMKCYARNPRLLALFYLAVGINKCERILFNLVFGRRERRVYSLHGSFLIFTPEALERLGSPFDERMFLFREEDHLARRAKALGIRMIYCPQVRVLHREDGSVGLLEEGTRGHMIRSLRVYFGLSGKGLSGEKG